MWKLYNDLGKWVASFEDLDVYEVEKHIDRDSESAREIAMELCHAASEWGGYKIEWAEKPDNIS